jgi:hypothetical protein
MRGIGAHPSLAPNSVVLQVSGARTRDGIRLPAFIVRSSGSVHQGVDIPRGQVYFFGG